ncbi:dephospho-CoA kinase [Parelusimicrobium proximum]|uniref:dephospho-CoA kinase n=1 Tax=Parelusimicrobium proximum TaxID=3228953 RepID=UPI003D16883C
MSKIIIGLTGVILGGKSEVLKRFARGGAFTVSSDEIVAELYGRKDVAASIKKKFKTTDKTEITNRIFNSPKDKKWLEGLLHPLVLKEAFARIKKAERDICVFEIPLLFEAGVESVADITMAVVCDRKTQLKRLKERNISKTDFLKRAASQYSAEEKSALADITVVNNGSKENLNKKTDRFFNTLKRLAEEKYAGKERS